MKNFLHKLKPVEQTGNPVVDESENKEREEYLKMILMTLFRIYLIF